MCLNFILFLWLKIFHSVCVCGCVTFYKSIYLWKYIWVVSTFWLLWIMLIWTLGYKWLLESLFSTILGIYLVVELVDHIVTLFLTFSGTDRFIFHNFVASFYIPISNVPEFQFLHIFNNTCYFLFYLFAYFWYSHPSECNLVSYYGFDLYLCNY